MSTFKGIVKEFPQIRIDYFRIQEGHPAPLACFLSHVHSDHLLGLESLKSPFVYCSAATKDILLRLEKYPARMNFAKGILESRKQTYYHLKNTLKCLPLETPTVIELSPGNEIRVTLFDANHCVGAVMFLIEGSGSAILYTGDIRSEHWWIQGLRSNPILVPYTTGLKTLDVIYLDTTFATKDKFYHKFPSKSEGIKELLEKVSKYPEYTKFYFTSWTFGYENVWLGLTSFLNCKIHLDPYRGGLYRLANSSGLMYPKEHYHLFGYQLGNHRKDGCMTEEPEAKIHSCERGSYCSYMEGDGKNEAVCIVPMVTRFEGVEVLEAGAGGGRGDMDSAQEVDVSDAVELAQLLRLCESRIKDAATLEDVQKYVLSSSRTLRQKLDIERHFTGDEDDEKLETFITDLTSMAKDNHKTDSKPLERGPEELPKIIRFPYSRHSSYSELCELVEAFQPLDIYPCTVDEANWNETVSMRSLFGQQVSTCVWRHDAEMREKLGLTSFANEETQSQLQGPLSFNLGSPTSTQRDRQDYGSSFESMPEQMATSNHSQPVRKEEDEDTQQIPETSSKRNLGKADIEEEEIASPRKKSVGQWAYDAALGTDSDVPDWHQFGGLASVKNNSTSQQSKELES